MIEDLNVDEARGQVAQLSLSWLCEPGMTLASISLISRKVGCDGDSSTYRLYKASRLAIPMLVVFADQQLLEVTAFDRDCGHGDGGEVAQ